MGLKQQPWIVTIDRLLACGQGCITCAGQAEPPGVRLKSSMPSCPVPEKRSSTRRPSISNWRMLNSASLTRSVVGQVRIPSGVFKRMPRAVPVITHIAEHHLFLKGPSALPVLRWTLYFS